jgi:5'-deoxynucleotidase YfbR-like HD superfamily hydrolase
MGGDHRRGNWIQVHSGGAFWPLDPRLEELHIEDVAQGLSHVCRFGGQCTTFYSVAQHSVFVSELCEEFTGPEADPERRRLNALAGLLHDAPEAFISDVPRPVKAHLPHFQEIEARLWDVCARKWGLAHAETGAPLFDEALVRRADDTALVTEKRQVMSRVLDWDLDEIVAPVERTVTPVSPPEARALFLARFRDLTHAGSGGHAES